MQRYPQLLYTIARIQNLHLLRTYCKIWLFGPPRKDKFGNLKIKALIKKTFLLMLSFVVDYEKETSQLCSASVTVPQVPMYNYSLAKTGFVWF